MRVACEEACPCVDFVRVHLTGWGWHVHANGLSDLKMELPATSTLSSFECQRLHVSCARLLATCETRGHQYAAEASRKTGQRFIPRILNRPRFRRRGSPSPYEIGSISPDRQFWAILEIGEKKTPFSCNTSWRGKKPNVILYIGILN